jgi:hypothetical protein
MKCSDLEILPTEELWTLHQKATATLTAKIIAEKKVLEDRLAQLNGRPRVFGRTIMQTAEQLDVYAEEYLALSMEPDISICRAKALMGISCCWIILAEQLRRLAQIEKEENERRAA